MLIDKHGTQDAGQGILAVDSSEDIPVGAVEEVDVPEKLGSTMVPETGLQVGSTLLDGVVLLLLLHLSIVVSRHQSRLLGWGDPHFHHNQSLVDSRVDQLFGLELLLAADPLGPIAAAAVVAVAIQTVPAAVTPDEDLVEVVAV